MDSGSGREDAVAQAGDYQAPRGSWCLFPGCLSGIRWGQVIGSLRGNWMWKTMGMISNRLAMDGQQIHH